MDKLTAQQLTDQRRNIAQAVVRMADDSMGGPWALVELTESAVSDSGNQLTSLTLYNRFTNSHVHIVVGICAEGETCPILVGW